ncbi:MAG: hypothetical protein J7621_00655 [Niastella sp.]|nr:hypothetical protein [Niastella sp.]
MQNFVYANGYKLKPDESIGPTSDQFTLIPHIGILQAGSTDQAAIVVTTLNLGYTWGGHDCTFTIIVKLKSSQQEEVEIGRAVFSGVADINTIVALQSSYIIPKEGKDIDIMFYWNILGSHNVLFSREQTWSGAAFISPIPVPGA